VVLFAGASGAIGLDETGWIRREFGFLVGSRHRFVAEGLAVAVIAPPTDRASLDGFRPTRRHVLDLKSVIAYLRATLGVPVWLVGHSRGTVSAAYVTAHLPPPEGPDGLVLTASLFVYSDGESVYSANPDAIRVPTLLVHHASDACHLTPPRMAPRYLDRLDNAPAKALIVIEGGWADGNPCRSWHYHGFRGREAETVRAIAEWIRAHTPARP
jgi:pimeloyl-ACP methyl ester carboxylesterase